MAITLLNALQELDQRYPYMFERARGKLFFTLGLMPILIWACDEIDTVLGIDKRGFHWFRLRMKGGYICLYYDLEPSPPALTSAIACIVARAVKEAEKTCFVCGMPAFMHWWYWGEMTLCKTHQPVDDNDQCWYPQWVDLAMEPQVDMDD